MILPVRVHLLTVTLDLITLNVLAAHFGLDYILECRVCPCCDVIQRVVALAPYIIHLSANERLPGSSGMERTLKDLGSASALLALISSTVILEIITGFAAKSSSSHQTE